MLYCTFPENVTETLIETRTTAILRRILSLVVSRRVPSDYVSVAVYDLRPPRDLDDLLNSDDFYRVRLHRNSHVRRYL